MKISVLLYNLYLPIGLEYMFIHLLGFHLLWQAYLNPAYFLLDHMMFLNNLQDIFVYYGYWSSVYHMCYIHIKNAMFKLEVYYVNSFSL